MTESLKEELIKIIIDKFLIAVLILIFGFFINIWLEKYKSYQSLSVHMVKTQAEKIGTVWELMYQYDEYTDDIIRQVARIQIDEKMIIPLFKKEFLMK